MKYISNRTIQKIEAFISKTYWREMLIIATLFLFSLLLRLLFLNAGIFHQDAVSLTRAVELFVETGHIKPIIEGRPVWVLINGLIFSIPYYLFGAVSAEVTLKVTHALFGSLSIIMLYLFTKELFNSRFTAFAAALLFSVNPIFFSITTFPMVHAFSIFFALLSFYLLIRGSNRKKTHLILLSTGIIGISLLVRISNLMFIIPHAVLYLMYHKKTFSWSKIKEFCINLILAYLPFVTLMIFSFRILRTQSVVANPWHNLIFGYTIQPNFFSYLADNAFSWITIPGIILSMTGLILILIYKKYKEFLFLSSWLFVFLFFYSNAYVWKYITIVGARYFSNILIPLTIFMGISISEIRRKVKAGRIIAPLLLLVIAIISFLTIYPVVDYRHDHSSPKEFISLFPNLTNNNVTFITHPIMAADLSYYLKKPLIICPLVINNNTLEEIDKVIKEAFSSGKEVYIFDECFPYILAHQHGVRAWEHFAISYMMEVSKPFIWEGGEHLETRLYLRKTRLIKLSEETGTDSEAAEN